MLHGWRHATVDVRSHVQDMEGIPEDETTQATSEDTRGEQSEVAASEARMSMQDTGARPLLS